MKILTRAVAWIHLGGFMLYEILVSSLRVAWEVVTPHATSRPGIIRVPIDCTSPAQIALLAHLVTLTPGTVSLDVTSDRRALYVHVMFLDDREEEIRSIKDGLEKRVRSVLP
ncbi:MAG: Na+/H+ antiporter subunit E [Planctomycetota bacterium]|nr:Na+/H+ antiporter subunit E [Planctomycetota bacterium]